MCVPAMPRTGKPMSVRMTNCGVLGWVTDKERGYRYQATHPVTGEAWPAIPRMLLDIWNDVANFPLPPEACLVNFYSAGAKMGVVRVEPQRQETRSEILYVIDLAVPEGLGEFADDIILEFFRGDDRFRMFAHARLLIGLL